MTATSDWLPQGKSSAICLTVDDVHPSKVAWDSLRLLQDLQSRHPKLKVTLFTTPQWRTIEPHPRRTLLTRLPIVRDLVFLVPVARRSEFRLDRHPEFCAFLRDWRGAQIGLHGLYHVTRGTTPILEFRGKSRRQCRAIVRRAMQRFEVAGLSIVPGMSPPGWEAPPPLLAAMEDLGLAFVASARDLDTPITAGASAAGSGMRGVALVHPQRVGRLVHIPTNFQATSTAERAAQILDSGGLLSIKCHAPAAGPHRMLDAITPEYCSRLDRVLRAMSDRFGEGIWWTSPDEIAARMIQA